MNNRMDKIEVASSFLMAAHALIDNAIDVLHTIGINVSFEEIMKKMMEADYESRTDGLPD